MKYPTNESMSLLANPQCHKLYVCKRWWLKYDYLPLISTGEILVLLPDAMPNEKLTPHYTILKHLPGLQYRTSHHIIQKSPCIRERSIRTQQYGNTLFFLLPGYPQVTPYSRIWLLKHDNITRKIWDIHTNADRVTLWQLLCTSVWI